MTAVSVCVRARGLARVCVRACICWCLCRVCVGIRCLRAQFGGSELELVLVAVEAMGEHLAASPAIVAVIEQRSEPSPRPSGAPLPGPGPGADTELHPASAELHPASVPLRVSPISARTGWARPVSGCASPSTPADTLARAWRCLPACMACVVPGVYTTLSASGSYICASTAYQQSADETAATRRRLGRVLVAKARKALETEEPAGSGPPSGSAGLSALAVCLSLYGR